MNPLVGQITLGVYAVLLAVGGIIGFAKAGSRPSLVAGLGSALVAAICLGLTLAGQRLGYPIGAVLAGMLLLFFGGRYAQGRKFMPGGLMAMVSLATLVVLAIVVMRSSPSV